MVWATRVALASVVMGAASAALGAEPGEKVEAIPSISQGVASALTALVVFGIVFAVLSVKVWPAITKALDERANKIRDEIEAAELARRQAKEALEQYQKSLADARAEAQRMIEQAKAENNNYRVTLKAQADAEIAALRQQATRDIEAAKRAAIGDLYQHAASLATVAAGRILKREITPGDQGRLIEESLGQLQGMKN
ncbi:MAG: F0F1 ATP synthase subunit B [Phycisphaeraceae bacterium]|nr:MAG: F0F1 ATP synthase subunit B [Phycisphaeraceae bacterium]